MFRVTRILICEVKFILKKSMKAALLSMCLFPGVGHLYLKKYVVGMLLAIGAATASYFIVSSVVQMAFEVMDKIQDGSISPDIDTIMEFVSQLSRAGEHPTSMAMMVLFICWVIGVLDSYRVGYMLERDRSVMGGNKT
jgi:hypothetical protein